MQGYFNRFTKFSHSRKGKGIIALGLYFGILVILDMTQIDPIDSLAHFIGLPNTLVAGTLFTIMAFIVFAAVARADERKYGRR